ncbi:MAG: lipid-A-disaccharide synthase [Candidatus Sumerlaeaceae bacterium]
MSPTVMFIAGEDSGDQHGARVIRELRALRPDVKVFGYGGTRMEAEGMQLTENLAQKFPIIGFTPVLQNLPRILGLLREAAQLLKTRRPDALVLIDYPGFNLRTAKVAKRLGIPVIYYISPQFWVWHKGRLKVIATTVDKMLVILPFEKDLYAAAGMKSEYVGHPLQDDETAVLPVQETRARLGVDPGSQLIGLLPGSRRSEIQRHLPLLLETARLIRQRFPGCSFVVPRAATIPESLLREYLGACPDVEVLIADRDLKSVRAAMDFAVCKSGTSTLELALLGVPMVIFYKVSAVTYAFAKRVVKIRWIGLVNIVAGREVVPELIQQDATPRRLSETVCGILGDSTRLEQMRAGLAEVRGRIGGPGAGKRVAGEICAVLESRARN